MTRVDKGQQKEMAKHMEEDREEWLEWVHEGRLQLIRSTVDWGIHMGTKATKNLVRSKRLMSASQYGSTD